MAVNNIKEVKNMSQLQKIKDAGKEVEFNQLLEGYVNDATARAQLVEVIDKTSLRSAETMKVIGDLQKSGKLKPMLFKQLIALENSMKSATPAAIPTTPTTPAATPAATPTTTTAPAATPTPLQDDSKAQAKAERDAKVKAEKEAKDKAKADAKAKKDAEKAAKQPSKGMPGRKRVVDMNVQRGDNSPTILKHPSLGGQFAAPPEKHWRKDSGGFKCMTALIEKAMTFEEYMAAMTAQGVTKTSAKGVWDFGGTQHSLELGWFLTETPTGSGKFQLVKQVANATFPTPVVEKKA